MVAQRTTFLEVLSAVLGMDADVMDAEGGDAMAAAAEEEEEVGRRRRRKAGDEGNPTQKKQKQKQKRRGAAAAGTLSPAVVVALEKLKKKAYALASDLRFVFRPQCKVYEALHRVV